MKCQLAGFFCVLLTITAVTAAEDFTPDYSPSLNVPRINGTIVIDGDLSESAWRTAAVADNFVETSPGDQIKPMVETRALIAYDYKNLYVAFICLDDPGSVRTSLRDRDEIFQDDYIGLLLDTYGDAGWAYELFANPYGIQGDLRRSQDNNEDDAFNMIWESRGIVTDSGYQVEIAVPFASLRFPDKPIQTWRANFWRDQRRDVRRQYSWVARDLNNSCFICQFGDLHGIEGIKPGQNLEIMPSAIAYQSSERNDEGTLVNSDPDAELSLNVRYGLTSNSSLEATVNPDFSQVESDAGQIDINTTYGLYYSETRPFFQEGANLFDTYITAIHTRSINDPAMAARYTGQFGRFSVALLTARDDNSTLLLPFRERNLLAQAGKSWSNIVRLHRTVGENSYIGFLLTDRHLDDFGPNDVHKGGSNTVTGIDGRIRLSASDHFEYQMLYAHTREVTDGHPIKIEVDGVDTTFDTTAIVSFPGLTRFDRDRHTVDLDGESYSGQALYFSYEHNSRGWAFDFDYNEYAPTFRADDGFQTYNDGRYMGGGAQMNFRPNGQFITAYYAGAEYGREWAYDGKMEFKFGDGTVDEWIRPWTQINLTGPTILYLSYLNSQERFAGYHFPGISRGEILIDVSPTEIISGEIDLEFGRSIYRTRPHWKTSGEDSVFIEPVLGWILETSAVLNLKPNQRFYTSLDFNYARMDYRDAYLRDRPEIADKRIYSGYILRSRTTYQFTRELFVRLVLQYDDFDETFNIEPLVTYRVNPFTKFFIGMTSSYNSYEMTRDDASTYDDWQTSSRQFFAKFQYLFRM
ncbi:MAG TPA: DUF5916 domain-containing protein [candidate division Zixibacteria bacterium]|nr:DUF5916 domain-containing protein [candidate division Zixibacteria bacterium]